MKQHSIKVLALLLTAVVLISSCSLNKMVKKHPEVKYEATPNPLEVHGGKIAVTIKGNIPAKYFNKKAAAFIQPVLKYEGGSVTLKPMYLKGEKAEGEGTTISSKTGGSFTYTDVIDYTPEMNKSELVVNPVAHLAKAGIDLNAKRSDILTKSKAVELGQVKLADGVIYTSQRLMNKGEALMAEHGYEKETILNKKGTIYFVVNRFDLDFKLKLNKDAANKAQLDTLKHYLALGYNIKNVDINAWASPEGEESRNQGLSENRSKSAVKWMEAEIEKMLKDKAKKAKVKAKDMKKFMKEEKAKLTLAYTPVAHGEDWEGFLASLEGSDIKEKNTIINVIKAQEDTKKREQEIRNMTLIYKQIEDKILPPLRRSEVSINFLEPKKAEEKIAMLSTEKPDSLDNKEILYAATLTQDNATKLKIYKSAIALYPTDWKAYNNAAYVAIQMGNASEAASLLEKANAISPNNKMIINNMGVAALMNKDYKNAKSYFETAQKLGAAQGYNMGVLMIREGNYSGALSSFGSKENDYNVGLAQLLNGNASTALKTLDNAPVNAQTYYLKAVAAARINNSSVMYESLKQAINLEKSYREQAKSDLEFAKFWSSSDFQNAVK